VSPDDATKELLDAIEALPIDADPEHVAADIEALRVAFPDPTDLVCAIIAVRAELMQAVRNPTSHGKELQHKQVGWRRSSFASQRNVRRPADLRLVFRPIEGGGIELRAFGHRFVPESVYFRAGLRR
jgi:hypothetical protein